MTQLTFTQENLPTSEEFQLLLLGAWLSSNPLDELRAFIMYPTGQQDSTLNDQVEEIKL